MCEQTVVARCSECGYNEEQVVDNSLRVGDTTGIKCPNCDHKDMFIESR